MWTREIDVFTTWHYVHTHTHTHSVVGVLLLLHVMFRSFIKCKWHGLVCVQAHTSSRCDRRGTRWTKVGGCSSIENLNTQQAIINWTSTEIRLNLMALLIVMMVCVVIPFVAALFCCFCCSWLRILPQDWKLDHTNCETLNYRTEWLLFAHYKTDCKKFSVGILFTRVLVWYDSYCATLPVFFRLWD